MTNYLFLCTDLKSYQILTSTGVNALLYMNDAMSAVGASSKYGSKQFKRKTHMKTRVVLDALMLGYTVLVVDVDIVFLQNPLHHLTCSSCDLQIQSDLTEGNSGFYLVRPTRAGIELHVKAWQRGMLSPEHTSNQKAIDRTYEAMKKKKEIKMKTLSLKQFPNGKYFWEMQHRMFAGDGPSVRKTVIVHNNWIFTKEAKIYRFKESLLWVYDEGGYYSDPYRMYITFHNPVDLGDSSSNRFFEMENLKIGLYLGALLNRTLILPSFHCYGGRTKASQHRKYCSLMTSLHVATFDKYFKSSYREHVFLQHSLVPDSVKASVTTPMVIQTSSMHTSPPLRSYVNNSSTDQDHIQLFKPQDPVGPTEEELLLWFSGISESVLNFQWLYGLMFDNLKNTVVYKSMQSRLQHAFKKSCYLQVGKC